MGIKGKKRQRQRREQAAQHIQHDQHADSSPELSLDLEVSPSSSSSSIASAPSTITSPEEPEMLTRHILICSIGNPAKLLTTRHSAGHILLPHLTTESLRASRQLGGPMADGPVFHAPEPSPPPSPTWSSLAEQAVLEPKKKQKPTKDLSSYHATLFQSTAFMNVSGPAVAKAWKSFISGIHGPERSAALLIVLHDELEKAVGTVKYKKDGSAGGHNGLSSIASSLPGHSVHKIGLGINRPVSRDRDDVADYVLSTMPRGDINRMIEDALPKVKEIIHELGTTGRYQQKKK
ncbi:hypothetical protein ABW21_db0205739 [Orbilia brochopaga]|nr:hypothetical protein ABW21_db0205739 [Drechslerella brochopaga]